MWNEQNYTLVWGIAFLWDWNENWPIPVLQPLLSFPNLLAYWCSTLAAASFRILNSSAGIPSPPLALLVMLPKAIWLHTPGCSRWVTIYHGFLGHEDLFCIVILCILAPGASLMTQMVKNLPVMQDIWVWSLEKGMATHSSVLAWKIHGQMILATYGPWGCRVRQDWATNTFTFMYTLHTHKDRLCF